MFYDTFLEILNSKPTSIDPIFKNTHFRRFVLDHKGKNTDTLQFLSQSLLETIKKPQQCLYNDKDYYLALDLYTHTYYLCYRELMMIDIDFKPGNEFSNILDYLDFLIPFCQRQQSLLIDIYQSRQGIHLFLINKRYHYRNLNHIQLMLDLKSDFYYCVYSYLRGWSVRLNRKRGNEKVIYQYIGRVGYGKADKYLEKLVRLHLEFTKILDDEEKSLMK